MKGGEYIKERGHEQIRVIWLIWPLEQQKKMLTSSGGRLSTMHCNGSYFQLILLTKRTNKIDFSKMLTF